MMEKAREAARNSADEYARLGMLTNGDSAAPLSEIIDDILSAFLSAAREDGWKLVRREASEEMCAAAAPRPAHWPSAGLDASRDVAVSIDQLSAGQTWRTMWDAAPEVKP